MINQTLGHNNPPEDIPTDIRNRNKALFDQFAELTDSAGQVPEVITTDEQHGKVLDLSKKMRAVIAQADALRKIELEPFKAKTDAVNATFKKPSEALQKVKEGLDSKHEDYAKRKADEERKRLEAEEEKKREEAARLQREAEEAERQKLEAQKKREEEERKAAEAEAARQKAIRDKEEAERKAEEEKQKAAKLAEERKAAEAEEAERRRKAKEQQAKDEEEAAARKEQERIDREAHEARMAKLREEEAAAKAAKKKAEDEAAEAKAKADEEKRVANEAEEKARAAKREEKSHDRDARGALEGAVRAERKADKIEGVIAGPSADLARSRSDYGATGTLTRRWECRLVDRQKITPDAIVALFPFINEDAISAAGFKFMMAQAQENRRLPGFVMEEVEVGTVR